MSAFESIFRMLWRVRKPFVFFRTPGSERIQLYFQEDSQNHQTTSLNAAGFVMRGFTQKDSYWYIPAEKSMFFDRSIGKPFCSKNIRLHPSESEKTDHITLVQKAIEAIAQTSLQKVVVSHRFDCAINNLDLVSLYLELERQHPEALVYFWHHPQTGSWIGATPERLLTHTGDKLQTMALAGTLPNKETPVPWTDKEKEEQQLVVDAIILGLEKIYPRSAIKCSERYTKAAGHLVHLCTDIEVANATSDLQRAIEILHPTPAIAGLPKVESLIFLANNEGYDRRYYSGILGPIAKDEKQLYVNLRCAEITDDNLGVYVGGGITAASQPENEWEEILRKSETILRCV